MPEVLTLSGSLLSASFIVWSWCGTRSGGGAVGYVGAFPEASSTASKMSASVSFCQSGRSGQSAT